MKVPGYDLPFVHAVADPTGPLAGHDQTDDWGSAESAWAEWAVSGPWAGVDLV
jgi:hypothetical protein